MPIGVILVDTLNKNLQYANHEEKRFIGEMEVQ